MATVQINLPVKAGGRSILTLNVCAKREGSSNDRMAFRIVRRMVGEPEVTLVGEPEFTLVPENDVRSWTFIDDNIDADGTATYVVQIKRLAGGGYVKEMVLLGQHLKR